jgi:hypothetical protein
VVAESSRCQGDPHAGLKNNEAAANIQNYNDLLNRPATEKQGFFNTTVRGLS